MTITEWCREYEVPRSSFYDWRKRFETREGRTPSLQEANVHFGFAPPSPVKHTPHSPAGTAKNASITAEVKSLRAENRQLLKTLGTTLRFEEAALQSTVVLPDSAPVPRYTRASHPEVDLVLCLGDWHIGDLICSSAVSGLNNYNLGIAVERMGQLTHALRRWTEGQRSCYTINTCHIFVLGDMISGGIHLELLTDEEFPPPEQCASAGRLLAQTLIEINTFCPNLSTTFLSADNHSRTTIKPRHKRKVDFSLGHVVYALTRAMLPRNLRHQFVEPSAPTVIVPVQGLRFLLQHGDYIRSYGITPDAAIEKAMMEEEVVRTGDNAFDVMVIGHFHRPSFKPHLVTNGSLCGRTEYEHSKRFRPIHPTQVSFLVHPTHGMFNFVPWNLCGDLSNTTIGNNNEPTG